MTVAQDLKEAELALIYIEHGKVGSYTLHYNFQTCPASGRREYNSVTLPLPPTGELIKTLKDMIISLRKQRAEELRAEAKKLEAKANAME